MKALCSIRIALFCVAICGALLHSVPAPAQQLPAQSTPRSESGPVDFNSTPPAFVQLSNEAANRSSFSLDRNTLGMVAGLVPDSEAEERHAIAKLDGVSVHVLRFGPAGISDQAAVNSIRADYHQRGLKHLVTNSAVLPASTGPKGPLHNGTTDLWLQMDGTNVRAAIALIESPRSLTLVTLAGDISAVDMLHLRGHFGIPRFDGDQFKDATRQ